MATAKNSSNFTTYFSIEIGVPALTKKPLVSLTDIALITKGKVKAE